MYLVGQSQLNIAHPGINTDAGHPDQRLWENTKRRLDRTACRNAAHHRNQNRNLTYMSPRPPARLASGQCHAYKENPGSFPLLWSRNP